MRRLAARAALAAVAVSLAAAGGSGYLVRRTDGGAEIAWNLSASAPNQVGGKITYFVDPAGVPDITPQQFGDAVRASVQSWEAVDHAAIAFEEDPSRPAGQKSGGDRVNRFGYTAGELGTFTFAAAFVASTGDRITDVDVVFNPTFDWAVQSPGDPTRADVQGVATHEWGHGIGLDHVPLGRSTMFFASPLGGVSLRSLEVDDQAAVAHAYPAPSLGTGFATVRGRVDVFGTTNDRGVQVTAVSFATGRPAAAHFSSPDGTWEIRGVPPGAYYLVASPIGTQKAGLGVYSGYWKSAVTGIVPAIRGQDGAADGTAGVVLLEAGEVLAGADLEVATAFSPLEDDDTTGTATPLALGRSAASRIEDTNDRDFFSFAGSTGQKVTVLLHARQIGSDLDPRIYLRSPAGIQLASSADISTGYTLPEGADLDCRILDFTLPTTGTYFVEVEAEESPESARPEDYFYVLTILAGGGSAHPATSGLAAAPPVAPADGASTVTLTFTPRTVQGTSIDAGAAITFDLVADGDPDGTLSPVVVDAGGGTWTGTIAAPAAGGADTVRALVDGTPVRSVVVSWRGAPDFAASDFTASPGRIRSDGAAQSTLLLVPRDGNGLPFGPGRTVEFLLAGTPDATAGATTDRGDGSYEARVTAGLAAETVDAGATVDGEPLGGTIPVAVGFPLGEVVDESLEAVEAMLAAIPGPPAKALPTLVKARDLLAAAAALDPGAEAPAVLAAAKGAAARLQAAARRGASPGDVPRDLAEAAREAAAAADAVAAPLADTPAEMRALGRARSLLAKGDALLLLGRWSKAAAKCRASLVQARKVQ
jgi:hypothetical protein